MRINNIIFIWVFLFSFVFYFTIMLAYPEAFFYYWFNKMNVPFFMTDSNILAYYYFYSLSFIFYLLFAPFFYSITYMVICSVNMLYSVAFSTRFFFYLLYSHSLAFYMNHFDFSYFFSNMSHFTISSMMEGIDFASFLSQYMGFYWDFFSLLSLMHFFVIVIMEIPHSCYAFSYNVSNVNSMSTMKNLLMDVKAHWMPYFWEIFVKVSFFRLFFYSIMLYFFSGEGLLADLLLICFTIGCVESSMFMFRSLFMLKSMCLGESM